MRDYFERILKQHRLQLPSRKELALQYTKLIENELVPSVAFRFGTNPIDGRVAWAMPEELSLSLHIIGGSGKGKTNALKYLGGQVIEQNKTTDHGMAFIDPHGEAAEHLFNFCVARGVDPGRVIYFDLQERDWVPVLNPLRPEDGIARTANGLVEAITRAFGLEFMMENPLTAETMVNTAIVLLENRYSLAETVFFGPNTPENLAVRAQLLEQVSDPSVRGYWQEIATLPQRDRRIETGSASRRFNFFLRFPTLRRMLGQTGAGIDFGEIMDQGKIAIFNLGQHGTSITDQGQRFIGSLILDQFKAAAGRRRKNKASPFYLFVDEFSRFVSHDTMEALAEARGFGLRLILAHQRLDQLMMKDQDPRLMRAVLAIPNKLIFGAGLVDDHFTLARQAYAPWVDVYKRKHEDWRRGFAPILKKIEIHSRATSRSHSDLESDATSSALGTGMGMGTVTPPYGDPTMTQHLHHMSVAGDTFGRGSADSTGEITSRSDAYITDHEEYRELAGVQFEGPEEQIFSRMQANIRRGVGGTLFMRAYQEEPQPVEMPEIEDISVRASDGEAYFERARRAQPRNFIRVLQADQEIAMRHQRLLGAAARSTAEPQVASSSGPRVRRKTPAHSQQTFAGAVAMPAEVAPVQDISDSRTLSHRAKRSG